MSKKYMILVGLSMLSVTGNTLTIGSPGDPNTGDCAPFGCARQYQQLYGSSLFAGGSIQITGLTLFNNNFVPGSISAADYTITLSTTSAAANGLSNTFANNLGVDDQLFFSGALGGLIGPTNQFTITGTTFLYDPSHGNLLLNITKSTDAGDFSVFLDVNSSVAGFSRIYAAGNSATADGGDNDYGLVTQFTFTPVSTSTPESASWLLLSGGLASIVAGRKLRGCGWLRRQASGPLSEHGHEIHFGRCVLREIDVQVPVSHIALGCDGPSGLGSRNSCRKSMGNGPNYQRSGHPIFFWQKSRSTSHSSIVLKGR